MNSPTACPRIDWDAVIERHNLREAYGSNQGYDISAESTIHELAHLYDCLGAGAFVHRLRYRLNDVINGTYKARFLGYGDEADWVAAADLAEVRVSAITSLTLEALGIEYHDGTIVDDLLVNLLNNNSWFDSHSKGETRELYEEFKTDFQCMDSAKALAKYLTDHQFDRADAPSHFGKPESHSEMKEKYDPLASLD